MSRLNPAITISGREIRQDGRPLLIAEVAQAHDGSLGFAHAFIDVVADAGFDAIKFQTHIAEAEFDQGRALPRAVQLRGRHSL